MWFKNECNRTSERLWEYASQRLSASETTQIETHLQQCARCQAEADAYRQTVGMLGAARQMPVPASQTTWRDLRPSLAPNRRPVLRSADFLPRLTLVGAGAALGATLLVVFFSGGHHATSIITPTTSSSASRQTMASGGSDATPATTDVAIKDPEPSATDNLSPDPSFGPIVPSVFAFSSTPRSAPAERPSVASVPKAPRVHRNSARISRLASNREYSKSSTTPADTGALDGRNVTPRSPQNYVLNPVSSSSDDDTAHHYVISSIPVSQNGSVASNDGADEGRAW